MTATHKNKPTEEKFERLVRAVGNEVTKRIGHNRTITWETADQENETWPTWQRAVIQVADCLGDGRYTVHYDTSSRMIRIGKRF